MTRTEGLGTWHVLASLDRKVLAVYGAALWEEADRKAARLECDTGAPVWVVTIQGDRPRIGDVLPENAGRIERR